MAALHEKMGGVQARLKAGEIDRKKVGEAYRNIRKEHATEMAEFAKSLSAEKREALKKAMGRAKRDGNKQDKVAPKGDKPGQKKVRPEKKARPEKKVRPEKKKKDNKAPGANNGGPQVFF